ncbi:MAG: hypothetical protein NZ874_07620, partial [Fimbriimonadales bacterium]|nr:hypothetical protein [Fimbriimonadales bacterium]
MYKTEFRYRGETLMLIAQPEGKGWKVILPDGSAHTVLHATADANNLTLHTPTGRIQVAFARTAQGVEIQYQGHVYRFQRAEPTRRGATQHS